MTIPFIPPKKLEVWTPGDYDGEPVGTALGIGSEYAIFNTMDGGYVLVVRWCGPGVSAWYHVQDFPCVTFGPHGEQLAKSGGIVAWMSAMHRMAALTCAEMVEETM